MLPPFEGISRKFCSFSPLVRTESYCTDSCKVYSEMFGFFFPPPGSYVAPKVKGFNCCARERRGFGRLSPTTNMKPSTPGCFSLIPGSASPKTPRLQIRVSGAASGRQGPTWGPPLAGQYPGPQCQASPVPPRACLVRLPSQFISFSSVNNCQGK